MLRAKAALPQGQRTAAALPCYPRTQHRCSARLQLPRRMICAAPPPIARVLTIASSTFGRSILDSSTDGRDLPHLQWLSRFTPFDSLRLSTLEELISTASVVSTAAGEEIAKAGCPALDLVIIRHGTAECDGETTTQKMQLGPGSVLGWSEGLLGQPHSRTITSCSNMTLWTVPVDVLTRLSSQPQTQGDYQLALSRYMSRQLEGVEAAMKESAVRLRALVPHLVAPPKHTVVGSSKYAERLRKQVVDAARDPTRRAVLIFGEPGLCKGRKAALLHFGSPQRDLPIVKVDGSDLDFSGSKIFGRMASPTPGLLQLLQEEGGGTLVIENAQNIPVALVPKLQQLMQDKSYRLAPEAMTQVVGDSWFPLEIAPEVRIILVASKPCTWAEQFATVIKVPPLRLRPADTKDYAKFFLGQVNAEGHGKEDQAVGLTNEAIKRLQSYSWPGNIMELEAAVKRAAVVGAISGQDLPEEVFWSATQAKDRFRWNLLHAFPELRRLVRSDVWPNGINFKFTAFVFPVIVAVLLFGPQDRDHNFVMNFFWAWWWPLIFVIYPLLGRIWCAVCPFMVFGELAQKLRLSTGATLLKWPREQAELYGPWFLFGLFVGILVWEEVWDLPHSAVLSGSLLLLITAGAVVCSSIFERRFWCRYLCPIGGMNGMFAKLSMTEVRAKQGVCSAEDSTFHCYKGGEAEDQGMVTAGCPLYSHPAQLLDNRHCVTCFECVKACPSSNVEFRLTFPGMQLWEGTHKHADHELALLFMLLGTVYLHNLPGLSAQLGLPLDPSGHTAWGWDLRGVSLEHIAVSLAVMATPGVLVWAVDAVMLRGALQSSPLYKAGAALVSKVLPGSVETQAAAAAAAMPRSPALLMSLGYGYLPFVWTATLVHFLPPLLLEAGSVLQVAALTAGWTEAAMAMPKLAASPDVVTFLQQVMLLTNTAAALVLTRWTSGASWRSIWPHSVIILALAAELWVLEGL